jgi:hypothetical protein
MNLPSGKGSEGRGRLPPGADSRIRTDDLIITNDLLYQLSYIGVLPFPFFLAMLAESFPCTNRLPLALHAGGERRDNSAGAVGRQIPAHRGAYRRAIDSPPG